MSTNSVLGNVSMCFTEVARTTGSDMQTQSACMCLPWVVGGSAGFTSGLSYRDLTALTSEPPCSHNTLND